MRSLLKRTIPTLLFLLINAFAFGQMPQRILGNVVDSVGAPLPFAHVELGKTGKHYLTDETGYFQIEDAEVPVELRIYSRGFETHTIRIDSGFVKDSVIDLNNIVLYQDLSVLGTFTLTEDGIEVLHHIPGTIIMDYDFIETFDLLLVNTKKDYDIRIVDRSEKIVSKVPLHFKPENLFHDCLGNIHVVGRDSVYQIYVQENTLNTMVPITRKAFEEFLEPCVAEINSTLYFREYGQHNQSVVYFTVSGKSDVQVLHHITDTEKALFADYFYLTKIAGRNSNGLIMESRGNAREFFDNQQFYRFTILNHTYHPLFQQSDSILIFDHYHNSILFFHNEEPVNSVDISYHLSNNWNQAIIQDAVKHQYYSVDIKNGIFILNLLDLETGKIVDMFPLTDQTFPENIKVHNGQVYYLYKTREDFTQVKLFRRRL